jgi:hypothetical protein
MFMIIFSLLIMSTMRAMLISMCSSMIVRVFFVFLLTELIRLVPCRFDEDLECRVQMYDKYKAREAQYPEDHKKYYLYTHEGEEGEYSRCYEGKKEKYDPDHDSAKIKKDHRIVELERDSDMSYSHASREGETFYHSFILEYDEEFRIGETHIQEK